MAARLTARNEVASSPPSAKSRSAARINRCGVSSTSLTPVHRENVTPLQASVQTMLEPGAEPPIHLEEAAARSTSTMDSTVDSLQHVFQTCFYSLFDRANVRRTTHHGDEGRRVMAK